MASTVWKLYDSDSAKGTCKVVSDDAGAMTLTVDAVAGNVINAATITDTSTGVIGQYYQDSNGFVKVAQG